jgi:hypothetical protein
MIRKVNKKIRKVNKTKKQRSKNNGLSLFLWYGKKRKEKQFRRRQTDTE